VFMTKYI